MATEQDHETLSKEQARAGETPRVTRYVLMISITLVVLIFAALLMLWS